MSILSYSIIRTKDKRQIKDNLFHKQSFEKQYHISDQIRRQNSVKLGQTAR